METCILCGRAFTKKFALSGHVNRSHIPIDIDSIESYYQLSHENWKTESSCKTCGNKTKFVNFTVGYKHYCNDFCRNNNKDKLEKSKQTWLKTLGVEHPSKCKAIQDQKKLTCLERCGYEYTSQSPEFREKVKNTFDERYGGCLHGSPETHAKINAIIKEKYGVEYITQNSDIQNKIIQTCLRKYGVERPAQCDAIKNKMKTTIRYRYGVEFYTQSENYRLKCKATCLKKYGVSHPMKSPAFRKARADLFFKKYGVYYLFQLESVKLKIHNTMIQRYGENPYKNPIIRNKARDTNIQRYGAPHPQQNKIIKQKTLATCNTKYGGVLGGSKIISERIKQTSLKKYGVEHPMQNPYILRKNHAAHITCYQLKSYVLPGGSPLMYQSLSELKFIKNCIANNIDITRGDIIPYAWNGVNRQYFVDFKININGVWKLIEIKGKHKWYYEDLESGLLAAKEQAAMQYSIDNNYLPFEMSFTSDLQHLGVFNKTGAEQGETTRAFNKPRTGIKGDYEIK